MQESAKNKGYDISIASLLETDKRRRELQQQVDELRTQRNEIAGQMKGGKPAPELIEQGRALKEELAKLESDLRDIEADFQAQMDAVPNIILDDVRAAMSFHKTGSPAAIATEVTSLFWLAGAVGGAAVAEVVNRGQSWLETRRLAQTTDRKSVV